MSIERTFANVEPAVTSDLSLLGLSSDEKAAEKREAKLIEAIREEFIATLDALKKMDGMSLNETSLPRAVEAAEKIGALAQVSEEFADRGEFHKNLTQAVRHLAETYLRMLGPTPSSVWNSDRVNNTVSEIREFLVQILAALPKN